MNIYKKISILLIWISFTLFFNIGKAQAESNLLIDRVGQLKEKNLQKLIATDKLIESLTLAKSKTNLKPMGLLRSISQRQEMVLKQDFLSRLLIHIDSHYRGQNELQFLIEQLGQMATHESKSKKPNLVLIRFIINCKNLLLDRPDTQNNSVELIDRYMNFTSISQLNTPSIFFDEQDYSNSSETFKARPTTPEELGNNIENKLQKLDRRNLRPTNTKTDTTNSLVRPYLVTDEQSYIEQRERLENKLKENKIPDKEIEKPLKKVRNIKPNDETPIMNKEQFQKLFNSK